MKWSRVLRKWPRTAFLCSTDIEEMKCSVTNDNMLKVKNVIFIFQLGLVKMSSIASLVFFSAKKNYLEYFYFTCLHAKSICSLWFVRIENSLKTQKYENHLIDILGCLFNQFLHELNDIELFLQYSRLKN